MNRESKILAQIELNEQILQKAKINIVTCGHCGSMMLHKLEDELIQCPFCDFESEPSDFGDYYYEGMELSAEFTIIKK